MQQPTPDPTTVPALSPTEFLRKWVTDRPEPAETVGASTMPAGGTVGFRHSPARTIIRQSYSIDISAQIPGHTCPCPLTEDPGMSFEVHTVTVEVAAKDQTIMQVTFTGGLIINTNAGPLVSSHPRSRTYQLHAREAWHNSLVAMPSWATPILVDAAARTREAFA